MERIIFVVLEPLEPIETEAMVESFQRLDILVAKLEIENVEIGFNASRGDRFGNHDDAAVDLEAQEDGGRWLIVFRSDFLDLRVLEQ